MDEKDVFQAEDEALVEKHKKARRRRKLRITLTIVIVVAAVLVAGVILVRYLRNRVAASVAGSGDELADGSVTAVDYSGTNSGGTTKYSADITIDREDDMLPGMNASAVITLSTESGILSIPADALIEDGDATYVYTTCDEKTGELGGLTEVTTGVSDGENVEITDGLDEGINFYSHITGILLCH
ncbi:MAG: efflux RND transporter periplasmic adaptor subunit [Clostridiales bacterium]|nr:efflux RND transporter periplasmic adaptor subunit [Clostridiales bacterium]